MFPWLKIGPVVIPTFIVVQVLLSTFLIYWAYTRVRTEKLDLKQAMDLSLLVLVSGFMGGRLGHILFEQFDFYANSPLEVFNFFSGGYVYFGGFVFSIICVVIYFIYKQVPKIEVFNWFDFFTPLVSFGTAFGRLGCFLAGCCFGKFCEYPWAISGRHPSQLYSFFAELLVFILVLFLERRKKFLELNAGTIFFIWLFSHSTHRFFIEYLRADFRGATYWTLSVSQLFSLVFILISGIALVRGQLRQGDRDRMKN